MEINESKNYVIFIFYAFINLRLLEIVKIVSVLDLD